MSDNFGYFGSMNIGGFSDDDEGDVDQVEVLKAKVEDLEKTIKLLTSLSNLSPPNTVFVLKIPTGETMDQRDVNALQKQLPKDSMLVCMPDDFKLEGLDDNDLRQLGLRRIASPLTDQEKYDNMILGK